MAGTDDPAAIGRKPSGLRESDSLGQMAGTSLLVGQLNKKENTKMSWLSKALGLDNTPLLKEINTVGKVVIATVSTIAPGAAPIIGALEAFGNAPITAGSAATLVSTIDPAAITAFETGLIAFLMKDKNISEAEADNILNGIAAAAGITTTTLTTTTVGAPASPSAALAPAVKALPAVDAYAPRIDAVTPDEGATGDEVTITGANLTGATSVTFSGVEAQFAEITDATITATVPELPGETLGVVVVSGMARGSATFGG